jgi:hypothetical protein
MTSDYKKYQDQKNNKEIELIIQDLKNKKLFKFAEIVKQTYINLNK